MSFFLLQNGGSIAKGPFPDICLEINENYYDEEIMNALLHCIKSRWNTVKINHPYKGSIILKKSLVVRLLVKLHL